MEIAEIVSYYVYEDSKKVEVSFRLSIDNEDEIRTDLLDISDFSDYGYSVINESKELNVLDFDEDEYFEDYDDFVDLDEDELTQFLNEYYIVNSDKLPRIDLL
jgi:chloramphenicol O-acetyltransferase